MVEKWNLDCVYSGYKYNFDNSQIKNYFSSTVNGYVSVTEPLLPRGLIAGFADRFLPVDLPSPWGHEFASHHGMDTWSFMCGKAYRLAYERLLVLLSVSTEVFLHHNSRTSRYDLSCVKVTFNPIGNKQTKSSICKTFVQMSFNRNIDSDMGLHSWQYNDLFQRTYKSRSVTVT